MTSFKKKQSTLILVVILLVTLFFGLKPKGYRFINQTRPVENKNGLAFPNIGMIYSAKPLGNIGITDQMTIVVSVRPFRTGKRLSKIITFFNEKCNELLAIEQWTDVIIATVYDSLGGKAAKAGIKSLSKDSVTQIFLKINTKELELEIGDKRQKMTVPENVIKPDYFSKAKMIIGLSLTGRNPFRGEICKLALFNQSLSTKDFNLPLGKEVPPELNQNSQPVAFFDFSDIRNRMVRDFSGSKWHLKVPIFPKIFKCEIFQPIKNLNDINRKLLADILINFLGFIPFGMAVYLLFWRKINSILQSVVYALISSLFLTLFIETAQVFIPTRTSQLSDLLLNVAGASAGILLVILILKNMHVRLQDEVITRNRNY